MVLVLLSGVSWAQGEAPAPPAGPGVPSGPAPELGGELKISRDQAILLALENNLDLIIARTGPQLAAQDLERARGAYDPRLFMDHRFDQRENPTFSTIQDFFGGPGATISQIAEKEWNYGAGFSGVLAAGITYSSSYSLQRLETSSAFSSLNPEWRANWGSELRIPLMKDLFSNQASITVERSGIGLDISIEDFREDLMDEIRDVEIAYWELGAARADERVAQKSLETARDLLEQTRIRYEVGVVSKVLVTQAEAGVAEREVNAIVALNRADGAEDALLNLIAVPTMGEYATTELVTDDPSFVDYSIDPIVANERAMRLRPEVRTARKRVEDAEAQLRLATNQLLPSLDLVASYRLSGLSGEPTPNPFTKLVPAPAFPTNSWGADDDFLGSSQNRNWALGARFELPLGNDTARADRARRRIELRRAQVSLRRTEQDIILDVRNAARVLRNSADSVGAAERRRVATEETLRAEQERLRLGDSTPFLVLEFEEDLAEAQSQVIASLQAYRNSITALERSQGTLLETRRISLVREMGRTAR
ncbi:MAG: TolC family protein [Myxococcota bacterium]